MKVCCIVYHSNLEKYPNEWIQRFKTSILRQTYRNFFIIELDYGGADHKIFDSSLLHSKKLNNHAEAMNYLMALAVEKGADYIANCNIDDHYSYDRFEKQIEYAKKGYDIISSNFTLIDEKGKPYHVHAFDKLNIYAELKKEHNILCHPVIMYSRKFCRENKYDPLLIPLEDLRLWQKTVYNYKYIILKDLLCFHRVHKQSVGHQ